MKVTKRVKILTLLSTIILFGVFSFVFAQVATTVSTDKNDYSPGETVLISGEGFTPETNLLVSITRPDSVVESCDAENCNSRFLDGPLTSNPEGSFSDYPYELNGIEGLYNLLVSDGTNTAETSFTDQGVGDVNQECSDKGFSFGIERFQCPNTSPNTDDASYSITVGGEAWNGCDGVDWTSSPEVAGVLSKEGTGTEVHPGGTSGSFSKAGDNDISNITFCGNDEPTPECEVNADCNDDLFCNGEEICFEGSCVPGEPQVIDDGYSCTNDFCDEETDSIVNTPDNSLCSTQEQCSVAFCDPENENKDENGCYIDFEDDGQGPDITQLSVTKIEEQCKIKINATADDQCSPVISGEYFLGGVTCGPEGTGEPFDSISPIDLQEHIYELIENGAIVNDGSLNIHVRAKDNVSEDGNWGNCETTNIQLDCLPPEYPTCELGNTVYNGEPDGIVVQEMCNPQEKLICGDNVKIEANICDSQSRIQLAEYFLNDMTLLNWLGINMTASDGVYDEKCEDVEALINNSDLVEGTNYITLHGKDGQENWGKFSPFLNVSFIKDTTAPSTNKSIEFANETYLKCDIQQAMGHDLTDGCYYVKPGTKIKLNAIDPDPQGTNEFAGNVVINYRVWYSNENDCSTAQNWTVIQEGQSQIDEMTMFTLDEDSCHLIEYWAADSCVNEEEHHFELDIVDSKAPVTEKEVSEPKVEGNANPIHYYITDETEITLNCEDQEPHPVDDVTLYWELFYNGESEDCNLTDEEWDLIDSGSSDGYKKFSDLQDSCHKLEYYCVDALGNVEEKQVEIDAVDNKHPEIEKEVIGPQFGQCPPKPLYYGDNEYYEGTEQYNNHEEECFIDGVSYINVTAIDPQPHPVNNESCYYWYYVFENEYDEEGERFPSSGVYSASLPIIQFPEESIHELHIVCEDALGNEVRDIEKFIVDKTPPETEKEFGYPIFTYYDWCVEVAEQECGYEGEGNCVYEKIQECLENSGGLNQEELYTPIWINNETPIWLYSEDQEPHPSGVQNLSYRVTLVNDSFCNDVELCQEEALGEGEWSLGDGSQAHFEIIDESCHLIEYYAVDNVNKVEKVNKQCVFVDTSAPETNKTVGEPKYPCTEFGFDEDECGPEDSNWPAWFVTNETPITLTCNDVEPHPVDHSELCFAVSWHIDKYTCEQNYGEWDEENEWCWLTEKYGYYYGQEENLVDEYYCVDLDENQEFEFNFKEDSLHNLEWFCEDALGNRGEVNIEWDNVDNEPPKIFIFNPTTEEREIERCTQGIVAQVFDEKSGVNESTIRAELWSTGEKVREVNLTKSIYGTWEGLMDKELPIGNYTLKVCAEDNLGNEYCEEIEEELVETLHVEFIHPSECVVDPETGGECDFTFNICMRGDNSVKFWLDKLGGIITPGMLNATIINPDTNETAFVGLRHELGINDETSCGEAGGFWDDQDLISDETLCWFSSEAGMLLLGPQCVDIIGKEEFDLHLDVPGNVAQAIGPGIHDLRYWIESQLMCEE